MNGIEPMRPINRMHEGAMMFWYGNDMSGWGFVIMASERFARGEIDESEFNSRVAMLRQSGS